MNLYQSKILSITYQEKEDLLVQQWSKEKIGIDDFKREMLNYRDILLDVVPSRVLWNQEHFSLDIPKYLFDWIEHTVNIPGKNIGVNKVAFVVSNDLYAQHSVSELFRQPDSVLKPRYFLSEHEAFNWLNEDLKIRSNEMISLESVDRSGIRLKLSNEFSGAMSILSRIVEERRFASDPSHLERFYSLKPRELEVLGLIAEGYKNKEIGNRLFISELTVATHRKKIIKKLQANNAMVLCRYALAFGLIH